MARGFETDKVWTARSRGFQMGTFAADGILIHLTGQVAWDADENIVGKGNVESQTRQCFENIR